MSDKEVKELISKIERYEILYDKFSLFVVSFEKEFHTTLPSNCFYVGLVRTIKANLNQMYSELRKIDPYQLEAVLKL